MTTKVKWLSHAGFMITSPNGKVVIIDPFMEGNPLCPIAVSDISAADLVLVSHDHADHVGSAIDISNQTGATVCASPETVGRFQQEMGLNTSNVINGGAGMGIGASAEVGGIVVTMTQAFHSSGTATAAGYVIKMEDGTTIYHAGDTGIFGSMELLGDLYDIDLAMLPIGGVFTMDAWQAAKALKLLKAKAAIPMHYKTWPFLEQDADRFVEMAKKEAHKTKVIVLEPGQEHNL